MSNFTAIRFNRPNCVALATTNYMKKNNKWQTSYWEQYFIGWYFNFFFCLMYSFSEWRALTDDMELWGLAMTYINSFFVSCIAFANSLSSIFCGEPHCRLWWLLIFADEQKKNSAFSLWVFACWLSCQCKSRNANHQTHEIQIENIERTIYDYRDEKNI